MGRRRGDHGATGLEYGLLVAGIALTTLIGASAVGPLVGDAFACVAETMSDPSTGSASCRSDGTGSPGGTGGGTGTDPGGGTGAGTGPAAGPTPTPTTSSPDPATSGTPSPTPSATPSTATATATP